MYEGDRRTQLALELLILTVVRPGELRGIRESEIDERLALWRIPATRMKMKVEHLVPLSTQALALIKRARPHGDGSGLLFPSPFYPGKPLSDGTLNSALTRLGYKGRTIGHLGLCQVLSVSRLARFEDLGRLEGIGGVGGGQAVCDRVAVDRLDALKDATGCLRGTSSLYLLDDVANVPRLELVHRGRTQCGERRGSRARR